MGALAPSIAALLLGTWMSLEALRTGAQDPDHGGALLFVTAGMIAALGAGGSTIGLALAQAGYSQRGEPGVWAPVRWASPIFVVLTGLIGSVVVGVLALTVGHPTTVQFRRVAAIPLLVGIVLAVRCWWLTWRVLGTTRTRRTSSGGTS